ncbi:hypothetical protein [Herbaspirillum sp. 1130]|jgi:hypothetical protein|uniref:hypothetical protein n=1 Tax=Herbaspirillum sp. 1130 TaxID=2806562 RepID=UPI001AE738D1|nr:hypothetical protein [Herbaspirillum sp. 1130]MBP1317787.1 hypothetical protein [Herbaspirillum sp. 1130]
MKRIFFFATQRDILAVTNDIEQKNSLKYILAHHHFHQRYSASDAPIFLSASAIPELGIAAGSQTGRCEHYLVAETSTLVEPVTRRIGAALPGGGELVTAFEMGNCRDCVELNVGGFWQETVLISGLVQTWSDSKPAQKLMRQFMSAIKKNFKEKIGAYWVGSEALKFLQDGGRLTLNVEASPSFDLKIPE